MSLITVLWSKGYLNGFHSQIHDDGIAVNCSEQTRSLHQPCIYIIYYRLHIIYDILYVIYYILYIIIILWLWMWDILMTHSHSVAWVYSKWSGWNLVYSVKTINYFVESKKTTWMIEFMQDLVLTLGVLAALARKTFWYKEN